MADMRDLVEAMNSTSAAINNANDQRKLGGNYDRALAAGNVAIALAIREAAIRLEIALRENR